MSKGVKVSLWSDAEPTRTSPAVVQLESCGVFTFHAWELYTLISTLLQDFTHLYQQVNRNYVPISWPAFVVFCFHGGSHSHVCGGDGS